MSFNYFCLKYHFLLKLKHHYITTLILSQPLTLPQLMNYKQQAAQSTSANPQGSSANRQVSHFGVKK